MCNGHMHWGSNVEAAAKTCLSRDSLVEDRDELSQVSQDLNYPTVILQIHLNFIKAVIISEILYFIVIKEN